jgi:FeS assembly protein IscX
MPGGDRSPIRQQDCQMMANRSGGHFQIQADLGRRGTGMPLYVLQNALASRGPHPTIVTARPFFANIYLRNFIDGKGRGAIIRPLAAKAWLSRRCRRPPRGKPGLAGMSLNWETTYAVAMELKRLHPNVRLEDVSLGQVHDWTLRLADFEDDPLLCNDDILASIYQEWYEVTLDG